MMKLSKAQQNMLANPSERDVDRLRNDAYYLYLDDKNALARHLNSLADKIERKLRNVATSSDRDQERRIRERDRAQHANSVDSGNSDHYF